MRMGIHIFRRFSPVFVVINITSVHKPQGTKLPSAEGIKIAHNNYSVRHLTTIAVLYIPGEG